MPERLNQKSQLSRLVDCAMGRVPADLLILNGRWVCVQTGEVLAETDIAVIDGRIAYVGTQGEHTRGPQTKVIEAGGRYLVPGLLDGHMHVESGMLTVSEFVRAVAPHGTTGMFIDPHEIANVFGMPGIRLMVDEAALQPVHVWVEMPSCVPSAPGFETPGAQIGPEDVEEAMSWPGIIGLGEMMNFPGVINTDPKIMAELEATRRAGKAISGHYPSTDLGLPFHGYVAGGPADDHEGTRLEDAVERARQGMRVMMRFGSAWQDVATQVKAITELGLDSRHFILCTDDCHSATLENEGHIDRVIRHAVEQGVDPVTAIQMATINTAEYYGLGGEIGSIAPGRSADLIFVEDLHNFHASMVFCHGKLVAEDGQMRIPRPSFAYPDWATHSIHFPRRLSEEDFGLPSPRVGEVDVNIIGVIENQAPTRHIRRKIIAPDGVIYPNIKDDLAKIALIERHTSSGRIQVGLVSGFGFTEPCAVATTVAHDCHQMIVVGTREADMALAANRLVTIQGGQVVVRQGEIIGQVELPIAGLVSDQPAEIVAAQANSVLDGFRACGCQLNNPNMQLSLLALVVIPELRISDLGLVDVQKFRFIPVVE